MLKIVFQFHTHNYPYQRSTDHQGVDQNDKRHKNMQGFLHSQFALQDHTLLGDYPTNMGQESFHNFETQFLIHSQN